MSRSLRITVTDPQGTEWDLTDRVVGDLKIDEETEEDLLLLRHADTDLELLDEDGEMSALFSTARPGQVWAVVIERETGKRGPLWERIFGGVLDLPMSLRFDYDERTVSVQVFSHSKALELASAEGIKRVVEGVTATVNSGSTNVTLSAGDTSDLAVGDQFTLAASGKTEQQTIQSITDSTHFKTIKEFSQSFTDAEFVLDTPYYRGKSVEWLAQQLFAEAGIVDTNVLLPASMGTMAFPSPLNTAGLGTITPSAIVEKNAKLSVFAIVAGTDKRYDADSVSSGFGSATSEAIRPDWRPYMTAEPATWRDAGDYDDGDRAWDIAGGDYYTLSHSTGYLILRKNGANIATVVSEGGVDFSHSFLDFFPSAGEIWVSYLGYGGGGVAKIKCYTPSGTHLRTFEAGGGGVRTVNDEAMVAVDTAVGNIAGIIDVGPIHLYTASGPHLELEARRGVQMWTFKKMGSLGYFAVRVENGKTYVTNWGLDGKIIFDAAISTTTSKRCYGAVFDGGGTLTPAYVCFGGGAWYACSSQFSGLVPYADFDGRSCADALKQLALVSACHLIVDHHGIGMLTGRDRLAEITDPLPVTGAPLKKTGMPVWEWWRNSVEVNGNTEDGEDLSVVVGNTGDSAKRLNVDVDLPVTLPWLSLIGQAYLQFLSPERPQLDLEVEEPEQLIRVLSRVRLDDGLVYWVLRSSLDLARQTQELQLAGEV